MTTTLAQHITKYDGEEIIGYTVQGGQCIDEVRRRLWERTGNAYHGIPKVAAAKDFWTHADLRYWEKHGRASGYVPLRDAIVVLKAHGDNPYGHVCITRDGSTQSTLYTFDQNWSHYRRCARIHGVGRVLPDVSATPARAGADFHWGLDRIR